MLAIRDMTLIVALWLRPGGRGRPYRPGCDRGGAGFGVTEFSGVRAYTPYNDINGEVVNFFRILRDRGAEVERAIALTPFSREEFHRAIVGSSQGSIPCDAAGGAQRSADDEVCEVEGATLSTYQLLEHPKVAGWAEGFAAGW